MAVNKLQEDIINKEIFGRNKIIVDDFKELESNKQQVVLPKLHALEIVRTIDIVRLQGNFTDIYLSDQTKKMVWRFLKYFSELLPYPFLRIHKSHIVNVIFIKSYHKVSGVYVPLDDGTEIEISPSYKDEFLQIFK